MDKEFMKPVAWMLECKTMTGDTGWILSWNQSGAGLCNRLSGKDHEKALYTAPPVPRDVLMAAMRDAVSDLKAGAFLADCGTDIAFSSVDYAALADRYARQLQPNLYTDKTVIVEVSGLTGVGKSGVAGEIEIAMKAIGLEVEWINGDEEKYLTHSDFIGALEMYRPKVVIVERNIPRAALVEKHHGSN